MTARTHAAGALAVGTLVRLSRATVAEVPDLPPGLALGGEIQAKVLAPDGETLVYHVYFPAECVTMFCSRRMLERMQ